MTNLIDKIKDEEVIHSSTIKWGLKKYLCHIFFYTVEPLDDLSYVICSILSSNDTHSCNKRVLGSLLGFSMEDQMLDGKHILYYDKAERELFYELLEIVEKEHLITVNNDNVVLTKLGEISLKENKHFSFFVGTQEIYEHLSLQSELPMALKMFPFYKDMGIYSDVCVNEGIWPNDKEVFDIIYSKADPLKKRLELNSKDPCHIYDARMQEYFDVDMRNILIHLYKVEDEYIPVVMNGEMVANRATNLLHEKVNWLKKENIVLECLFDKLWHDKSAILDYTNLINYFEFVDFEELTKDTRTVWSDKNLLNVIIEHSTPTCWRNISRYCDIDVLHSIIKTHKDNIHWNIVSGRIDDDFLICSFADYPWDLDIISADSNRKENVIEKLILTRKETQEDWNWEELQNRLSKDFILGNLDVVKVDLSSFTKDEPNIRELIVKNIDGKWNWNIIVNDFDLSFIYENLDILSDHIDLQVLVDRVFTDKYWSSVFVKSNTFRSVISIASNNGGSLSSAVFNDKNYLWSPEMIDLLTDNGLLCWSSTPYMAGFECNQYLLWNSAFFKKYSSLVKTKEGKHYISHQIDDINIIINSPHFGWDWDAVSSNVALLADKQLYERYGKKLNWKIVFENRPEIDFIQSIPNINTLIGEDNDAWSIFSSFASIDYVITKYKTQKYPWNWSVLTERMFEKLKLDHIGNPLFIDKWDWSFLSEHLSDEFLTSNMEKYCLYWDWNVILTRLLSVDNKNQHSVIDNIAKIISSISDEDKKYSAWHAFSIQYSFIELKQLILRTTHDPKYQWDISYFCNHSDFHLFRDLDECRYFVDWNVLSESSAIDNCLKYDKRIGIKHQAWIDKVKSVINNNSNKWNFHLLSHFDSLRDEKWFVYQHKEKIDWQFISEHSRVLSSNNKNDFNGIIDSLKDFIDFDSLFKRDDIDIEQVIRICPRADINYNDLISRGVYNITFEIVKRNSSYNWDWFLVSSQPSFKTNSSFLLSHMDCNFNWEYLSEQDNKYIWSDFKLILAITANNSIYELVNWYSVSSYDYFPIENGLLSLLPAAKLNWKKISSRNDIIDYIDQFVDYLDWHILSENECFNSDKLDYLNKYKRHLDWTVICGKAGFVFSDVILGQFYNYIDWKIASDSKDIKFSNELVEHYKDKWDWPVLAKNKAFNNVIDINGLNYVAQSNIVEFISHFPIKPKAYHFTHMDNAVKIIRAMKLQSRNAANGSFSNSAGSNVNRTNKAHRFARFYFVPKSPTQFYNECLGKDKDDYRYYDKAVNLGLPKCPLPVFFIFDVEEILMKFPQSCYYSNGNMQKDASMCFKVIENPNRIKAKEIYKNSIDTFDERQQEFLIETELDFSKLKDVQICCYDYYQAEMLKHELGNCKWADIVTVNSDLYIHTNKLLFFDEDKDTISVSTTYRSQFEFRIKYSSGVSPNIINKENVLREREHSVYLKSYISVKKNTPFEIYFEVDSPKKGSWLIYRNN